MDQGEKKTSMQRLKSLELHGFKTFASRYEFAFAGQITAIVGPNGSGKSNVADAIRWVLGEQSYSLLRAKKTEDMIFSGSEGRPRSGMASATIVFDNSNGWLPIDFSEVAITRRAYRDGQNEYLLNNQRVRLKDVTELLAQSGLAERTYTIIGQGLVDAALSLKAEERRRLFEEAAGIGLHRSRREEALRRLESTQRNLERVEDILAELQPRLRSLERQARRTMEYEQIKTDLHVILREWYGYHWHNAQRELGDGQEAARQREVSLEQARAVQAVIDEKMGSLRGRIQAARTRLDGWRRQMAELNERREQFDRSLAVADERLRSLAIQRQSGESELARLADELAFYQERLETAQGESGQLQAELDEAGLQLQQARRFLQARQDERNRAEQEVQEARRAQAALTARQAHLGARTTERKEQLERQRSLLADQGKNAAGGEAELQAAQSRLQAAKKELAACSQNVQKATETLAAHQKRLAEAEAARKEALEARAGFQAQAARQQAQLDVLEQAERSLAGYAAGARLLLQEKRSSLSGAPGALGAGLETPAALETAIGAALNEYLDAVLIDEADLETALQLLEGSKTRGVLLPLDKWEQGVQNHQALQPLLGDPDVVGIAADLIRYPENLHLPVRALLGAVLVVKDRQAARRLLPGLRRLGVAEARLVTLQGELFLASGPVVAGQEGKASILSRPRQRKELQDNLAGMKEQLQAAERKAAGLAQTLAELNAGRAQLQGLVETANANERAAAREHSQQELAVEKAQRALAWQREQAGRLENEIQQAQREITQAEAELKKLETEIHTAAETQRGKIAALAALALDELQTQMAHWNTRSAVAERAMADVKKRLSEQAVAQERLQRARQAMQERLAQSDADREALTREQAETRLTEKNVRQEIEALKLQLQPAEVELADLDQDYGSFQEKDAAARQALSQAEHHHAQARITLARRQETLESLRRRVEDDFGLVAFRYVETVSGPTPLPLDGLVEQLPVVQEISVDLEENIKRQRAQLRRIGPVNPDAHTEFQEVKERYDFMISQVADLKLAEDGIREVITELDGLMEHEFRKTFDAVAAEFRENFTRLFGGGSARLVLTTPDDMTGTGIDIEARLPGRREQGLALLSGGERSLTAAALVFSLLRVSPTPFCLLDEVDAMLDEANVGRFRELLRELSENTQFVVVTHNRNTVQAADVIYGVTMGQDSTSQVISLKLDDVSKIVAD